MYADHNNFFFDSLFVDALIISVAACGGTTVSLVPRVYNNLCKLIFL